MSDKRKKCKLDSEKKHVTAKEKNKKKQRLVLESNDLKHVNGGSDELDFSGSQPDSKRGGYA
jgi:hypothetical protein